jgi:hypothetical protein
LKRPAKKAQGQKVPAGQSYTEAAGDSEDTNEEEADDVEEDKLEEEDDVDLDLHVTCNEDISLRAVDPEPVNTGGIWA